MVCQGQKGDMWWRKVNKVGNVVQDESGAIIRDRTSRLFVAVGRSLGFTFIAV